MIIIHEHMYVGTLGRRMVMNSTTGNEKTRRVRKLGSSQKCLSGAWTPLHTYDWCTGSQRESVSSRAATQVAP